MQQLFVAVRLKFADKFKSIAKLRKSGFRAVDIPAKKYNLT